MTRPSNCPTCGSVLVPAGPGAHCPRCLLLAGLGAGRPDAQPTGCAPTVSDESVRVSSPEPDAALLGEARRDETREVAGRTIGRYTLLHEIGEGGFGVVYLAEQNEPVRRKVALKVLKPGMDTREIVARFEAERRALALMDHPNIAQVHDGGSTAGGRPFFVMEWVKGVPLTKYCDERRLNLRQRLELFMDVLSAVQHAHQKGIIHRDLKPSNILVATHEGKPVVKVIDFGIAKALGSELVGRTAFTRLGHLIGTPEYMSPEQASPNAVDVDTRSDVYSAGVVLYELLIGHTPIDGTKLRASSHAEMQRLICETDPPRPSVRLAALGDGRVEVAGRRDTEPARLARQVRGDLDWIVMKAIEKDRTRRYATAAGLSSDIHRYLKDEPVSARPPGMGYRFGKFARRNKAGLAVTALIAVILLAATVVSVYEALEARKMLRMASLSEARALRLTGEGGRRFDALKSLGTAAAIKKGADVLDEFVSVLGVADLRPWESWDSPARLYDLAAVAPDFKSHALGAQDGTVTVCLLPPPSRSGPGTKRPSPASPLPRPSPASDPPVLAVLPGKGVPVNWLLRHSPDSRLLLIGHAGNGASSVQATLWDWQANAVLGSIDGISRRAADFSPDSTVLAAALGPTLALFDARTGRRLRDWPGPTGQPYGLRFRPDGKAVAVSSLDDGTVSVVDLESGRVLATREFNSPRGIDWHRDNRRLAVACVGGIVVWHTTVPEQTKTIAQPPKATIDRVAWSHSTELLASSGWQQPVTLHDGALGQSLVVKNGEVKDLRFSPADRQSERASDTRLGLLWEEGKLGLMEVADGGIARHAAGEAHQEALRNTAWHPGGGVLATVSDHAVRFWNKELRDLGGLRVEHGRFAAFTPHGFILVASTIQRRACTLDGTPPVLRLGRPEMLDPRAGWDYASTTADGSLFAAAGHDRALLIDLTGRQPTREIGDHAKASQAALSPAGEWLATGTYYGTGVKIWSVADGGLVHEFTHHDRCSLGFSPKGEWLVVGTGSQYYFYRTGTWQLVDHLPCKTVEDPGWLAWSPPARNTVFALEPEDFSLSMHYVQDFKLFASPQFERQRPLSFHPGGALLLTADPSHRIHLWNLFLIRKTLDNFGLDLKDQRGQVLRALPNPAELPLVESSEFEESASAAQ